MEPTTITLSNDTIEFIKKFTQLATTMGMDFAILSKDLTRARDEALQRFIIDSDNTITGEGFDYIVLSNLKLLSARLALMKDNCVIQAIVKPDENGERAIRKLIMKSGRSTIEYCTMTATVLKSPRRVIDLFDSSITIETDDIDQVSQALRALPQHKDKEYVIIANNGNDISIEIQDINKDKYNRVLNTKVTGPQFLYRYNSKVLLNILRLNKASCVIQIGEEQGYLKTKLDGFDVFIIPTIEA